MIKKLVVLSVKGSSDEWFEKMTRDEQKRYLKKHPNSPYHKGHHGFARKGHGSEAEENVTDKRNISEKLLPSSDKSRGKVGKPGGTRPPKSTDDIQPDPRKGEKVDPDEYGKWVDHLNKQRRCSKDQPLDRAVTPSGSMVLGIDPRTAKQHDVVDMIKKVVPKDVPVTFIPDSDSPSHNVQDSLQKHFGDITIDDWGYNGVDHKGLHKRIQSHEKKGRRVIVCPDNKHLKSMKGLNDD